MLPESGTYEREALEQEAHDVAMDLLHEEYGNIANALYRVYMHFRNRFVDDRSIDIAEAMIDARMLEACVADDWAEAIRERYTAPA